MKRAVDAHTSFCLCFSSYTLITPFFLCASWWKKYSILAHWPEPLSNCDLYFYLWFKGILVKQYRMAHSTGFSLIVDPLSLFLLSLHQIYLAAEYTGALLKVFKPNPGPHPAGNGEGLPSTLLHLRGLWLLPGRGALHRGCCLPDTLHWGLPQVTALAYLIMCVEMTKISDWGMEVLFGSILFLLKLNELYFSLYIWDQLQRLIWT